MSRGDMTVADRLARIRSLLKGLAGPLGNGEMFAWASPGGADSMPQEVFALIDGAGLLERWHPDVPVNVPDSPSGLVSRLHEVGEPAAVQTLAWLMSVTLAYRMRGRYDESRAREVVQAMGDLLGYGTRWWTNTDRTGWKPVTRHVMDGVVIGTGNGVIVTVLAVDED